MLWSYSHVSQILPLIWSIILLPIGLPENRVSDQASYPHKNQRLREPLGLPPCDLIESIYDRQAGEQVQPYDNYA